MAALVQELLVDFARTWAQNNPVLGQNIIGIESDTGKSKLGDGRTVWGNLGYTTFTFLSAGNTLAGYLAPAAKTLPFATSIPVDAATANVFNITLTASTATIASPVNPSEGQTIRFRLTQGGGGSFAIAWGAAYDFGTVGAPTLSTPAGKLDIVAFDYVSSLGAWCCLGSAFGF
jgi:hypothetical protein